MKDKIDQLIDEGNKFTFSNNNYRNQYGAFSKATADYLAWIGTVEDFIISNYGEDSSPHKIYKKLDHRFLNGYEQDKFDDNHTKLIAALKSCFKIQPKTNKSKLTETEILNNLLNKFHSVVLQLRKRYNGRQTLDVQDEYDVQDLLHCILKLHFNDIRKEEWTPSYAGGSSRMDFLLKEEELVIEVKMTRQGLTDKDLGKQLIEDKAKYKAHPNCKKLICFTYDPEGRIINPKGIQNDLNQADNDFIVEIIIKPDN